MKYRRGSTMEVFSYQSWRCARIVASEGNSYTVSYDVYPGFTNEDDVERVSVNFIRPCPQLEVSEGWVPGDVAEVFHNLGWKMAIVLKDFGLDQFVVRLVGSSHEYEVTKSELRVRQSYQNGEWIVIGKVSSDQDLHKRNGNQDVYTKDYYFDAQNNHRVIESRIVSSRTLKRASPCSYSQDETNKKRARKLRMSEKVDDGYASSSGSCSINSYKHYETYYGSSFVEDYESDAASVCQSGYHEERQSQSQSQESDESSEAVADEIHRLELRAYRSTMAALHASGPLNWEKETMVTNLRRSLHISNDEHLVMLKNLLSASSKTNNR